MVRPPKGSRPHRVENGNPGFLGLSRAQRIQLSLRTLFGVSK